MCMYLLCITKLPDNRRLKGCEQWGRVVSGKMLHSSGSLITSCLHCGLRINVFLFVYVQVDPGYLQMNL